MVVFSHSTFIDWLYLFRGHAIRSGFKARFDQPHSYSVESISHEPGNGRGHGRKLVLKFENENLT